MAAIAANRVGIGQICPNFNTLNPKKSHTQFLGKPLLFKPQLSSLSTLKSRKRCMVIGAGFELFDPVRDLFVGVGVGLPCTVMECGDIIYRSTLPRSNGLTLTVPGVILALGTVSCLWATPGVAPGFWDMFVLAFVERIFRPTFKKDDFVLGKKLGEGAFGVVYKVSLANNKKPSVKEGDLVVKKATEYGAVEIWMNERVRRACASSCADVLYGFMEKSSKKEGEYWLVWRFEGESTLSDLLTSREFPYNVDCCNRSIYRGGEFGYTRLVATKKKLTLSYVGNHDGEVHDTVEILATGEVLSGSGSASGEKTEFPDTVLEGGMASPIFSQFVKGGSVLLLGAFVGYVIGFVSRSRKETPASGNSWLPVKTEDS